MNKRYKMNRIKMKRLLRTDILIFSACCTVGVLFCCCVISSTRAKSLSKPISVPISHSPEVHSISVPNNITASSRISSSPLVNRELLQRKGKSVFFGKIASSSSSLEAQSPPTYLDLKTRANVETVLSISNVSLYDYSDSATDNVLDEVDYDYVSFPKMKRGTSHSHNETMSTQISSSSGEENYTSSSVLNSPSHQPQPSEPPTTTSSTNSEVSDPATDFATTSNTTRTTTLPYAAVHEDDATTSSPSSLMSVAETQNTTSEAVQNRLDENEASSPLRESDQPQASTGLTTSQSQNIEVETTTMLHSDSAETVVKEKVPNLSSSEDNVITSMTTTSSTTTTTTITSAAVTDSPEESLPVVVFEADPKWYGNPKVFILDDYEVFRQRGCVDFSCKNDV